MEWLRLNHFLLYNIMRNGWPRKNVDTKNYIVKINQRSLTTYITFLYIKYKILFENFQRAIGASVVHIITYTLFLWPIKKNLDGQAWAFFVAVCVQCIYSESWPDDILCAPFLILLHTDINRSKRYFNVDTRIYAT